MASIYNYRYNGDSLFNGAVGIVGAEDLVNANPIPAFSVAVAGNSVGLPIGVTTTLPINANGNITTSNGSNLTLNSQGGRIILTGIANLTTTPNAANNTANTVILARVTATSGTDQAGDIKLSDISTTGGTLNIGTTPGATQTINLGTTGTVVNIAGSPLNPTNFSVQYFLQRTTTAGPTAVPLNGFNPATTANTSYLVIVDCAFHKNTPSGTPTSISAGGIQRSWIVQNSGATVTTSPSILSFTRYGTAATDTTLNSANITIAPNGSNYQLSLVPPTTITEVIWSVRVQVITAPTTAP